MPALCGPVRYRERLRLRPPALVKMNLATAYPRAYVTRRVSPADSISVPFATRRAADGFLQPFLDLFRIRRCQIKIRRDPAFPGCIYSEMKMCLAPCFAGCTAEEYAVEVGRVVEFLGSGGASLLQELARQREAASSELDFERAAALHRRVEKVEAVRLSMPELVRRLDALNAVVLERAAQPDTIAVFAVRAGRIADPFLLQFDDLASQPRSVEEILREVLQPVSSPPRGPAGKADPGRARRTPQVTARLRRNAKIIWLFWRDGFMAAREKARSFTRRPSRTAGPIVAFCAPARASSLREIPPHSHERIAAARWICPKEWFGCWLLPATGFDSDCETRVSMLVCG